MGARRPGTFKPIALALALVLPALVQAETHVVFALGYKFEPAEVRIKPGDTVRWENREKVQYHSVYFAALNDPVQDYFFPGESRERTFDKAGTYDYICEPHWESHRMGGRVLVGE
jgi:plastocyanin